MHNLILSVDNVQISYKHFSIKNVKFTLASGDIFGLVGRSGAGKSTILAALIGIKKPDSGKIDVLLDGKLISIKHVLGYSPQGNALFPTLSLEENIFTFGKLYGLRKKDIQFRMESLLKRLDLQHCEKKRLNQLSGGMQKRADLAVTLIHDPDIIILDEPFTGLDISLQRFIWSLLKELASQGKIVIISSHLLSDIQKHCNEFGLVDEGQFYNTQMIRKTLNDTAEKSLEIFLEKLFTRDLLREQQ